MAQPNSAPAFNQLTFAPVFRLELQRSVNFGLGGPMRLPFVICSSVLLSAIVISSAQEPQQPPARPKSNLIPDHFVNLQVLPRDIKKPQLVGMMKQFCIT